MDYRQRIISALRELAMFRGFSGVTVDELASHTGISKRTIYRYFKSKDEIIESVFAEFMNDIRQMMLKAMNSSHNPVEKIINVVMGIAQNVKIVQPPMLYDLQRHYPHLWERLEEFRTNNIQHIFESIIMKNRNYFNKNINPKIFTTALLAGIRAVATPSFIIENNLTPEETVRSLFSIYLYGLLEERDNIPDINKMPLLTDPAAFK
ncbi:transcriptional regulator [Desulfocucumis palustris]|uniref:Transcriptional regulator n=1 Tax=Desulfocucumis palustris TaxID=1898651 RepID=A0A2L2XGE7_9FIRM|nr:TetR/AcrR family transcriptional regulator [Desulfocucumis palustris]GBF35074.1 transcriptional regulator [Desulfocucumis palustris]